VSRKESYAEVNKELDDRYARLESAIWALALLLGTLCVSMLLAYAWVSVRGHFLNDDMDVVSASLGGG
jgi:hypothetical protein